MDNQAIAEKIKNLCKKSQIPVKSLLEACQINRNFIYDLQHKDAAPSIDKITKIAAHFGVSVDYLLGRTENPQGEIPFALSRPKGYDDLSEEERTFIENTIETILKNKKNR